jgi:hypothetical protein
MADKPNVGFSSDGAHRPAFAFSFSTPTSVLFEHEATQTRTPKKSSARFTI